MLLGTTALIAATAFLSAAVYIHVAEHPARAGLDDAAMLQQWQRSYPRALVMQVGLIGVAGLSGLAAWAVLGRPGFLLGALLMLANVPATYALIMPINRRLMATRARDAGPQSRTALLRWNRLHGLRTGLALAAVLSFCAAQ